MQCRKKAFPALHFSCCFDLNLIQTLPPAVCKVQQFDHATADPTDRIAKSDDAGSVGNEMRYHIQIDLTQPDKSAEHDNHRPPGITPPAQRSRQHMIDAIKQKKCYVSAYEQNTKGDDGGIRRKKADGRRSK